MIWDSRGVGREMGFCQPWAEARANRGAEARSTARSRICESLVMRVLYTASNTYIQCFQDWTDHRESPKTLRCTFYQIDHIWWAPSRLKKSLALIFLEQWAKTFRLQFPKTLYALRGEEAGGNNYNQRQLILMFLVLAWSQKNASAKRGLDSGTAILGTVHICSESTQRWHSERIICLDPKYDLLSVPHQPIFLWHNRWQGDTG